MSDKERITISFPEDEEDLLEEIDYLVKQGVYDSRTEVIVDALDSSSDVDELTILYDAAVSSLYSAERQNKYAVAENAKQHILRNFPGSKMADLLEE